MRKGSGEVERDLEGVTSQIDAHKAENKRRERRKKSEARAAQGEIWRVFWWRRPTVRRRWGFRLRLERGRKVSRRSRFSTVRRRRRELSRSFSSQGGEFVGTGAEAVHAEYGNLPGSDVSSLEEDLLCRAYF